MLDACARCINTISVFATAPYYVKAGAFGIASYVSLGSIVSILSNVILVPDSRRMGQQRRRYSRCRWDSLPCSE